MLSTIKLLIVTFFGVLGIKHFREEVLLDIFDNPFQYTTSVTTGMFTYIQLSTPTAELVIPEIIKFFFFIFGAFFSCIVVFITKKLLEPLWNQKVKRPFYKWLKLKEEDD